MPRSWGTFGAAVEFSCEHILPGIGFVFSENDDFVGIDSDDSSRNVSAVTSNAPAEDVLSEHRFQGLPSNTSALRRAFSISRLVSMVKRSLR